MSDEQVTTGTETEGVTPAPESASEATGRTFTEAELNAHLAGMRRKYDAKVSDLQTQLDAKSKPPEKTSPPDKANGENSELLSEVKQLRFENAASKLGIDLEDNKQRVLFAAYEASGERDAASWLKENWGVPEAKTPETAPPQEPTQPQRFSDQGNISGQQSWEHKPSALDWSSEDVNRIMAEKGPDALGFIRSQFELALKNVKLRKG